MLLVVVVLLSLLCTVAAGLWRTMSLDADILYERELSIKNNYITQQVMERVLDFIKSNGDAFFSQRTRQQLPLTFTLDDRGVQVQRKIFTVTIHEYKGKAVLPTLCIAVQMLNFQNTS